jgi:imidazolonepropionase-like amidohydrolase
MSKLSGRPERVQNLNFLFMKYLFVNIPTRNARFAVFVAALAASLHTVAQSPVPAPAQKSAVLILGATAHVGNGTVIANSAIAFENGKIALVADASTLRVDRTKYGKIFDAAGKHVYPGFIAPDTRLGLVEIDAVRATNDFAEAGSFNPNARAIVAYNTDSDVIPTVRSHGTLLAQIVPAGSGVGGTSSVVQLDAWNWEDAAYRVDDGIHLSWPPLRSFGGFETGNPEFRNNENYAKEVQALRKTFEEARAYAQTPAPAQKNLKFEAMRGLFNGKQKLYLHTDNARTIQEAVLTARQFDLNPVLVGGDDAWLVSDFLKANNVPVILGRTQRIPSREDEDYDQAYKTAAQLHEKGILFAFSEEGGWRQRNLGFQAGQAVAFGLPYEAAVSALTLNTAKIMGIDDTTGSLEAGKDANLFISEGDALDMRSSRVTAAFIQGREVNLDDKQKQLHRRFLSRE